MTRKESLKTTLLAGLITISFGGWLLHYRIHLPSANPANYIPFLAGIISVIVIPAMFMKRDLAPFAYILNGMMVVIGIITMAHFSIAHFKGPLTLHALLFNTIFPDIVMLTAKFFMGKALFDVIITQDLNAPVAGRFLRYPNTGFWLLHLILMSLVYTAGHLLWKA